MDNDKRKDFPTEWLNLLRFLSIFFIVWSHFDNRIFAEVHPDGLNIQRLFFFPPAAWSRIFYGYTGKYAVAMLCVLSGFVTAWVCRHKDTGSLLQFAVKRYLRLILPVCGMSVLYLAVRSLSGSGSYTFYEIVSGLFLLGSDTFSGYNWCLPAFFTGNILIRILSRQEEKTGKIRPEARCMILLAGLLCGFLAAYKLYNSWLFWTMAVLSGFLVYECYTLIDIRLPWYVTVLLLIVMYWLPRGEESMKIYLRCTVASCIAVYVLLHMRSLTERLSSFCRKKNAVAVLGYSYSLFIVHGFTMNLFLEQVIDRVHTWTGYWWLTYAVTFTGKLALDLFLSAVIHALFEKKIYRSCCRGLEIIVTKCRHL